MSGSASMHECRARYHALSAQANMQGSRATAPRFWGIKDLRFGNGIQLPHEYVPCGARRAYARALMTEKMQRSSRGCDRQVLTVSLGTPPGMVPAKKQADGDRQAI